MDFNINSINGWVQKIQNFLMNFQDNPHNQQWVMIFIGIGLMIWGVGMWVWYMRRAYRYKVYEG